MQRVQILHSTNIIIIFSIMLFCPSSVPFGKNNANSCNLNSNFTIKKIYIFVIRIIIKEN